MNCALKSEPITHFEISGTFPIIIKKCISHNTTWRELMLGVTMWDNSNASFPCAGKGMTDENVERNKATHYIFSESRHEKLNAIQIENRNMKYSVWIFVVKKKKYIISTYLFLWETFRFCNNIRCLTIQL